MGLRLAQNRYRWLWIPARASLGRDDGWGCRYSVLTSAPNRQRNHVIRVTNGPLQHRVLQLVFKAVGGTDAALGGEGAAEHRAAVRQSAVLEAALDQFVDREHRIERALLVKLALAVDHRKGAQDHPVPVTDDVLEFPQHRGDRLVAHLLGNGDAVAFH